VFLPIDTPLQFLTDLTTITLSFSYICKWECSKLRITMQEVKKAIIKKFHIQDSKYNHSFFSKYTWGLQEDGWQVVKSRKQSRCASARRGTSVNLRGRCFNCFSPNHLVASCRYPPRCFRCFKLGHQASRCPAIQAGPLQLKTPGRLRDRLEFDRSYPVGKRSV
jgi:hypothetical protein